MLSLFSGIGAFEKALTRQNIDYELVNYCEIDKYASKAYSLIHNESESKNLGDITKVDETKLPDFDLMTWGFPCTDISVAGKQKGFKDEDGNLTRSGLYYEGLRILKERKPKYSIIENVKALTQKKFKTEFEQILRDLESEGYNNYWKVLNAKDYGIPQNRERVFIVSIRKDIDNGMFKFPEGYDNGIRLKDILEDVVDEKYYISDDKTKKLLDELKENKELQNAVLDTRQHIDKRVGKGVRLYDNGICPTLTGSEYKEPKKVIKIGNVNPSGNGMNGCVYSEDGLAPTVTTNKGEGHKILTNDCMCVGRIDIKGHDYIKRVYSPEGISPTVPTCCGGNHEPKILEDFYSNREIREYENYSPTLRADRQGLKVLQRGIQFTRKGISKEVEICNTLTANDPSRALGNNNPITGVMTDYRIRKLTPLECFRLMGFDDQNHYILKENKISDTQLYKMAGNSIVVNVLEGIFKNLFIKE